MVLTVAGIVVKILGGLNRIFLSRLLGGEGIGLYQMAYPVYILLLSIIGAGIPIAVSIMIAEEAAKGHYSGVRRIFHVTLAFMTVVAVVCGLALPFGAHGLVEMGIVRDSRAFPALAVLAPALSLSVIACCFRGYFQGLQLMTPTALSQMADQFVRVCTMLVLAWILLPKGLEWAAAGAAFGAVPGAAAGLVLIAFLYYRHSRHPMPDDDGVFVIQSPRRIIRRLIVLAVPVAAANMLLPAVASIDLFIVPLRLEAAGYSTHQATALYGYLTGMANGLVQLPAILTIALATSLVPAVSAAFSQRNRDVILDRTDTAMRIANVITGLPGVSRPGRTHFPAPLCDAGSGTGHLRPVHFGLPRRPPADHQRPFAGHGPYGRPAVQHGRCGRRQDHPQLALDGHSLAGRSRRRLGDQCRFGRRYGAQPLLCP